MALANTRTIVPQHEIDDINKRVYETFYNGVYRCGFAIKQQVYEQALAAMFDTRDWLEIRLGKNRYLLGEAITGADWRLFPTPFRFDAIYYSLFKCSLHHIYDAFGTSLPF